MNKLQILAVSTVLAVSSMSTNAQVNKMDDGQLAEVNGQTLLLAAYVTREVVEVSGKLIAASVEKGQEVHDAAHIAGQAAKDHAKQAVVDGVAKAKGGHASAHAAHASAHASAHLVAQAAKDHAKQAVVDGVAKAKAAPAAAHAAAHAAKAKATQAAVNGIAKAQSAHLAAHAARQAVHDAARNKAIAAGAGVLGLAESLGLRNYHP